MILGSGLVASAATVAYIMAKPNVYRGYATLVLPLSSSNASINLALPLLSRDSSPLSVLLGIAKSDLVFSQIVERTKLPRKTVRENLTWKEDSATSQISVTYTDTNPQRARNVVTIALEELGKSSRAISTSLAATNIVDLRAALDSRTETLQKSEDELLAMQAKLRTAIDPNNPFSGGQYLARLKEVEIELGKVETELRAVRETAIRRGEPAVTVPTAGATSNPSWKQRVTDVEYELRVAETRFGPDAPEVEQLRRKLTVTRNQLQTEISKYIQSVQSNVASEVAMLVARKQILEWQRAYIADLAKIAPSEALELQRVIREVSAQTAALVETRKQYEAAALDQQVYRVQYTTLVTPQVTPNPVNKGRTKATIISFVAGALTCSVIIVLVNIRDRNRETAAVAPETTAPHPTNDDLNENL